MRILCLSVCLLLCTGVTSAHDAWVETNVSVIRAGDAVMVDLKLGNHGNDHRDFKLAGKVKLEGSSLNVSFPNGIRLDLLPTLIDLGYAPNEGYWSSKVVAPYAGTYVVAHQSDAVVRHGRQVRSIKSAKTFFLAGVLLDKLKDVGEGWKAPLGHALEIVPVSHPVLYTGPGMPIDVQVLWKGKPLPDAKVSFIPQGVELKSGFDENYERMTDAEGRAGFTPKSGSRYLIVTHLKKDDEKSEDYSSTSYSATMQLLIPEVCPCCE